MGAAGARNRFLLHLIHESCQVSRLGWKNMEINDGRDAEGRFWKEKKHKKDNKKLKKSE